jgi:hypothetical protein
MDLAHRFLFLSILSLSVIFLIYIDRALFFLGRLIWKLLAKRFPKLDYQLIKIKAEKNEDILYISTSFMALYLVVLVFWILI